MTGQITDSGVTSNSNGVTSNSKLTLPPLPAGIRLLTNQESDAVQAENPMAPRSLEQCPACHGEGEFLGLVGTEGDTATFVCSCADQVILSRYLLHCGIGLAYQKISWDDLYGADPHALGAIMNWVTNVEANLRAGYGMLLTGEVNGTGKTSMGVLALKCALGYGARGFFAPFSEIVSRLISSWNDQETAIRYYARCRNSELLVIDDVGREVKQRRFVTGDEQQGMVDFGSASSEFALESILRHRISMGLATIITTNLSVEQLATHYGRHFQSLLTEAAEVVEVGGADWRTNARERMRDQAERGISRQARIG